MEKVKIFVCAHKNSSEIRRSYPYIPIQGGVIKSNFDLGFARDDFGDNISAKNNRYSEWSVIYWIWKNCKDVEYIGLNHYRRYFDINITVDNVDELMKDIDLIAVRKHNMSKRSRLKDLASMTSQEDAYLFADSILTICPDCKDALLKYLYDSRRSYPYSMFLMRREQFEDYCNFIFPILFDLESRIKEHGYSRQQRALGYFGEFSLGLYIYYRNLRVKGVNAVGSGEEHANSSHLKDILRKGYQFVNKIIELPCTCPQNIFVPDVIRNGLKNDGIVLKSI